MHLGFPRPAVFILAFVFIAVVLGGVLRVLLHSLNLPYCWRCGAGVRRSLSISSADSFFKSVFLVPYRCDTCLWRFYGLKSWRGESLLPSLGKVISTDSHSRLNRPG
jgi:hypothetical protein